MIDTSAEGTETVSEVVQTNPDDRGRRVRTKEGETELPEMRGVLERVWMAKSRRRRVSRVGRGDLWRVNFDDLKL